MNRRFPMIVAAVLAITASACGKTEDRNSAVPSPSPVQTAGNQPAATAAPAAEPGPKISFTGDEGGTITKVDLQQNKVLDTIKTEGSVHNVQISPDGSILGATLVPAAGGHGAGHGDAKGAALFYDASSNQLLKKVEVGHHPAHIVFTKNQQYALVTNNEDHNVTVIDMKTYQVTATIATGKGPHGFRISEDSRTAYIANMSEDTVSVIDLGAMKETRKIKVGQTPVTTALTRDGKKMVVTLHTENAAAIVDLDTDKVEKIPVGAGPAQVYIQADDKAALVANQGTEKSPSNTVTKIDLQSKQMTAIIETGKGAHGVVASPDNSRIYVTNMFDDTLSVIDNVQNKEIAEIPVGDIPNGVTLAP